MSSHETKVSCHALRRCQHDGSLGDNKISIGVSITSHVRGDLWTPFESMVDFMADWVQAVFHSKGWYTRYWNCPCGRVGFERVMVMDRCESSVFFPFFFCFNHSNSYQFQSVWIRSNLLSSCSRLFWTDEVVKSIHAGRRLRARISLPNNYSFRIIMYASLKITPGEYD